MKKKLFLSSILVFFFACMLYAQTADEIIRKVENIMYPDAKCQMRLEGKSSGKTETYEFDAFAEILTRKSLSAFHTLFNEWLCPPYAGSQCLAV